MSTSQCARTRFFLHVDPRPVAAAGVVVVQSCEVVGRATELTEHSSHPGGLDLNPASL